MRGAGVAEAYLVGGCVRDEAISVASKSPDLDVALPRVGGEVAQKVAASLKATPVALDYENDTWRLGDAGGQLCDLVGYRAGNIVEDLKRRDFTINAIGFDLMGDKGLLDPLDGLGDLARGTLAACGPGVIEEDPLRVLRAYRMEATLPVAACEELSAELARCAGLVTGCAPERIRDELFKILGGARGARTIRKMSEGPILTELFPFMEKWRGMYQGEYHAHDLLEHSLRCVENVERLAVETFDGELGQGLEAHLAAYHESAITRGALLKWTALMHDLAKPEKLTIEEGGRYRFIGHDVAGGERIESVMEGLKVGKRATRAARALVAGHMRLFGLAHQETPTVRSRRRFIRDLGEETPEAVLLSLGDEAATGDTAPAYEPLLLTAREILELYWDESEECEPLLMGRDLVKELGVSPGPLVGEILARIAQAEYDGEVSDRGEALEFAKEVLKG